MGAIGVGGGSPDGGSMKGNGGASTGAPRWIVM